MKFAKKILAPALVAAGIATGALAPATAQAADIITDYTFSGSNFSPSTPYAALNGTFSIDYNTITHSFTLSALSLMMGSISFDTTNSGLTTNGGLLYIGGNATQPSGISSINSNDFLIDFSFNSATGSLGTMNVFKYAAKGYLGLRQAGTFSYSEVAAGVPEPAAWGMMIGGFALAGLAMRRNRTRTSVRFA